MLDLQPRIKAGNADAAYLLCECIRKEESIVKTAEFLVSIGCWIMADMIIYLAYRSGWLSQYQGMLWFGMV